MLQNWMSMFSLIHYSYFPLITTKKYVSLLISSELEYVN